MESMKTLKEIQEKYQEILKKRNELDVELIMLQGEARLLQEMESPVKEEVKEEA